MGGGDMRVRRNAAVADTARWRSRQEGMHSCVSGNIYVYTNGEG